MSDRPSKLKEWAHRYQLELLYVFGSRAKEVLLWSKGEIESLASGPADIDIGVKPKAGCNLTVDDKVHLALALEKLFGVNRVDLVSFTEADPFLAANIIRGERLVAVDEYLADEYVLYILRRAGDLIPFERERMALILGEETTPTNAG